MTKILQRVNGLHLYWVWSLAFATITKRGYISNIRASVLL